MRSYAFLPPCSLPTTRSPIHHHTSHIHPHPHSKHTIAPPRINASANGSLPTPHDPPSSVFTKDGRTYEAIDWKLVEQLAATLTLAVSGGEWDVILAITRGGLAPAALVAEGLGIRNVLAATIMFYTDQGDAFFGLRVPRFLAFPPAALLRGRRVLIVDDVWDSGATAIAVRDRVMRAGAANAAVAVLHFKKDNPHRLDGQPEFFAHTTDRWIIYPWEVLARSQFQAQIEAAAGVADHVSGGIAERSIHMKAPTTTSASASASASVPASAQVDAEH